MRPLNANLDPFVHHPALRDLISDPDKSFFRNFKPSDLDERMKAMDMPDGWRHSDVEVEDARLTYLAGRLDQDLWIFAYGSLKWDPAFKFAEVRRAHAPKHARKFILKDTIGARGTPEIPGLMAALDDGTGCDGLVFRIAKDEAEHESGVFWRRELLGHAYRPAFAKVSTHLGDVEALTVIANHEADVIRPDLTREEQIRYIATGKGFLGTSMEYLENIVAHFEVMGIDDSEVSQLLAGARRYIASSNK